MTIERDGEELFLAALMDQPETIDDYGDMAGKFSDVVFNALYNAIRDSFAEDGEVSHPAIIRRMNDAGIAEPDAVEGLGRVVTTITKHRGKQSAECINGLWLQRQALSFMERIRNMEPSEVSAAIPSMLQAFEEVETTKVKGMADYLKEGFNEDIDRFSNALKTGFSCFDEDGGIYTGLYVIAAGSSLGKTTFCLQLADQVAANGGHVLYFTLEQTRCELLSKSLARYTTRFCDMDSKHALSAMAIRRGFASEAVGKALGAYASEVENRLTVYDGMFAVSVSDIVRTVKAYSRKHNVNPMVIVDYVQALKLEIQQDMRLNVDHSMHELKKLSNSGFPVVVVSAVNRSSYDRESDFSALKESGGIEYTVDVAEFLQLEALGEINKERDENERRRRIREELEMPCRKLELIRRKNRFGVCTGTYGFSYYPAHDLFVEGTPF